MKDYLWNAAARALERAPVVRPRLAPLFGEPDLTPELPAREFRRAHVPSVDADDAFQKSPAPVEPYSVEQANAQLQPAALKVGPIPPEADRQAKPQLNPIKIESVPPSQRFQSELERQIGLDSQIPLNWSIPIHNPQSQQVHPTSPKVSDIRRQPVPQRYADSNPNPVAGSVQEERAPVRLNTKHETTALRETKTLVENARIGQEPLHSKQRVSPAAGQRETVNHSEARSPAIRVNVARNPVPSPFSRNTGIEPVPTIQVTIGRVEVRAVPAAQKISATASKQSTNNLEDYLKRRSRGGE